MVRFCAVATVAVELAQSSLLRCRPGGPERGAEERQRPAAAAVANVPSESVDMPFYNSLPNKFRERK
jgi:hypothetical protein